MAWPVSPCQRVQIEQVRDRGRRYVGSEFRLPLEQQIVVTDRIVLHVIVCMWRQWRSVRVSRTLVDGVFAIFSWPAGHKSCRQTLPLPAGEVESMDVRAEIGRMTTAENDHRTRRAMTRSEDGAVPGLGDRGESCPTTPWSKPVSTQCSSYSLFQIERWIE